MSTIATTPTPQIGRTPLLVGIAAVGIVAVSAVAVPRLSATFGSTTTATGTSVTTAQDAVEHRADSAKAASIAAANARTSASVQRQLDQQAKTLGTAVGLGTGAAAIGSTLREQVGGLQQTYTYTPSVATQSAPKFVYNGRGLQEIAPAVVGSAVAGSTLRQQVGGLQQTFPYSPSTSGPAHVQELTSLGEHTTWADDFVPPYDDPAWTPYIQKHYAAPQPAPRRAPHRAR